MKNLYKALFNVQKEIGLTLTKDAKNPFFKSNYVSLPNLSENIQPVLQKNGLLLQQPPVSVDGRTYVKTKITHVDSGETEEILTLVTSVKENDPQAMGSGITYMRRFALMAYLGIAAEDDDANAASGKSTTSNVTAGPPKTIQPVTATATTTTKTTFKKPTKVESVTNNDGWSD